MPPFDPETPVRNKRKNVRTPSKPSRSALDLGSSSDDDDDNHDALNLSVHLSTRKPTEKRQRNVFGPDGTPARLGKFSNATTPAKRREQRQQAMEMCDNDVNMATSEVVKLYQKSIQLCTSNKINSTNAWELGLIDHIERAIDPSNTGEINFQRAGSAIDASCKIFSARVDNVHRKVYKVLDDLTRNRNSRKEKDGDDMDGDPTKLKRKARSGVTIEKNLSKITLDVFDTEVDPMFRQTSANFDEGGARGLLLNNLYLKAGGELVFDLSSARVNVPSLLPEHETDGPEPKDLSDLPTPEELSNVDWEDYRNRMIPRVCALENASICQSLSMFSFNESAIKTELDFGVNLNDQTFNMEDLNLNMDEGPGQEDGPELGGNDDFGAYDDMPNMWEPEKTEVKTELGAFSSEAALEACMGTLDTSGMDEGTIHNEHKVGDVLIALAHQPQNDYHFFPQVTNSRNNNWAGPDHWLKSSIRSTNPRNTAGEKRKEPRMQFRIDFTKTCSEDWHKRLACSKASTTLSRSTLDKLSEAKATLPMDVHYRTDELRRLFLKPDCKIVQRRQAVADDQVLGTTTMVYNYDNQRDNDYCRDVGDGEGDYGKDDNGMMGLGMDDDDDVSGFDGFTEDVQDHIRVDRLPKFDLGFDDLDLVEPPKTVGRINIGYARTAKQVDVRMLKKKLWSQINTDKPPNDTPEAEGGDQNKENEADNNQTGQDISFKSVCQQVQSTLSTNQSRDVSVPISFVCLLHLANEKGLSIEQLDPELMGDLQIRRMAAALNT